MEMSWIQRHALTVLLRGEVTRLKDMCPDGVAANLFTYHLDGLVTDKYIAKTGRGLYALTNKGLKLAGTFSTATLHATENIKTVIMLYGERDGKKLLFRWSRQPYIGRVTLTYDRVALGTSLKTGIENALHDKLGTTAPVTYMTSCLVLIYRQNDLISHMNALIYRVDLDEVGLPFISRNGEAFLADKRTESLLDGVATTLQSLAHAQEPFDIKWRY